jgi:NAD(P)-dependent dehydrogenase (short-subunit alcohol dehydrogenase family)
VVSTAGKVHFGACSETGRNSAIGLKDKLMGQVNLVLIGRDYANDDGSFTLTSGVLSHDPIRFGVCASLVNGALDCFARAAAIELPRGLRINVVSPGLLDESAAALGDYFRGHETVPGTRANAVKSVEGALTGQVFSVL